MTTMVTERVLSVHHWNENLFSFKTTRNPGLRFENGHFVMIGLPDGPSAIMRAYSIASTNYEDHLEFLSIKVPNGAFTTRLQKIRPGDSLVVSRKPVGTLVVRDLKPGRHLYLLSTGTGLAPFLSLVRDPEVYERFEKVILVHGVRHIGDLAYRAYLSQELPQHEVLGEWVREKLIYYPTATREPFVNNGRITEVLTSAAFFRDIGLSPLNPAHDRAMICGSADMLRDTAALLDGVGFEVSPRTGVPGDYVIERAFIEK
jgi:ferredoxin/flavodoxin---NADP+ reductase